MPMLMAPLVKAGFTSEDAVAASGTFASFILGWVIYEQSAEASNYIASMVDLAMAFEFGLTALVKGLHQQLVVQCHPFVGAGKSGFRRKKVSRPFTIAPEQRTSHSE
jgi:hypothetical protein